MKARKKKKSLPKKKAPARSGKSPAHLVKDEPEAMDMQSILSEVHGGAERRRLEHWEQIECPYCGEGFEVHIDAAEDGQTIYQDCHVCCKPISIFIQVEDEDVHVSIARA